MDPPYSLWEAVLTEWKPMATAPEGEIMGYAIHGSHASQRYRVGHRFDAKYPGVWDSVIDPVTGRFALCSDWTELPPAPEKKP